MLPGDFVTINNSKPQKEVKEEEKVLAWTQGNLEFGNIPLIEAARIISRHYGVKVTVEKEVEMKQQKGILPNDNLDVLLKTLEETGLRITRKNDEIIISAPKP